MADESVANIEVRAIRSRIGIRSFTLLLEDAREPFNGRLGKLALNPQATEFVMTRGVTWAGDVIGQYLIE